jgi:hypothetical protein
MKAARLIGSITELGLITLVVASFAVAQNNGSIRFANELIIQDNSAKTANQAANPQPLKQVPSPLNDIALLSSSKVMYNSLGIIIRNASRKQVLVAIHDSKGRKVMAKTYTAGLSTINIKTSQFRAGTYVYSVMIGDSLYSRPFIVTP